MGGKFQPKLKGPNVILEIGMAITAGLICGFGWKRIQWEGQRKYREFYDGLENGEISLVSAE